MNEAAPDTRRTALAVASRRRLLEVLRSAGTPLDVAGLAAAVGLHVSTARSHLDVLHRAGLVRREVERAGRSGRPRQLYSPRQVPEEGGGYRELAAVLAGSLAADPELGQHRAEQAGLRWAKQAQPAEDGVSWEEGTRRVGELFDRLGFAPRLVDDPQQRHLELDGCPFRDLARTHPQVICAVHLGLLRGTLRRLQLPATAEAAGLRPFVAPELCIADMPFPIEPEQPAH